MLGGDNPLLLSRNWTSWVISKWRCLGWSQVHSLYPQMESNSRSPKILDIISTSPRLSWPQGIEPICLALKIWGELSFSIIALAHRKADWFTGQLLWTLPLSSTFVSIILIFSGISEEIAWFLLKGDKHIVRLCNDTIGVLIAFLKADSLICLFSFLLFGS